MKELWVFWRLFWIGYKLGSKGYYLNKMSNELRTGVMRIAEEHIRETLLTDKNIADFLVCVINSSDG